ncbi:MAG: hypothetical protein M0Z36_11830 [Thermaerobacter sp.]|nr:hypothetical protein [Thermaerobacter sp.]
MLSPRRRTVMLSAHHADRALPAASADLATHPSVDEAIVVDDGSTGDTVAVVPESPTIILGEIRV